MLYKLWSLKHQDLINANLMIDTRVEKYKGDQHDVNYRQLIVEYGRELEKNTNKTQA